MTPDPTPTEEFPKLLDLALAEAKDGTQELVEKYQLTGRHSFRLEPDRGRLGFGDIEFELQVVGALDTAKGMWRWEWADGSLPREVGLAAAHAKAFGEANEIEVLTSPASPATEADCWRYAAFAARLIDWPAIYRAPLPSGLIVFVAFRPIHTGPAGSITISS
jgi:hypothetical protein